MADVWKIASSAVFGAISGALAASGVVIVGQAAANAVLCAGSELTSQLIYNEGVYEMKSIVKILLLLSIISVSLSMIWFLLGSTACFQRGFDVVETVIFIIVWWPALSFVVLAVMALKQGWLPVTTSGKSGLIVTVIILIVVIILSAAFVATFIQNTTVYGWIKESVIKDYAQTTADGKYEYRLELINMFQRNSYARICVKDIESGEESNIRLDIPTEKMYAVSGGEGYTNDETTDYLWSELAPSEDENVYILTTTEFFDRKNSYCFQINMKNMTAIFMADCG